PRRPVGFRHAGQYVLRPGIGARADPVSLRDLRDRAGVCLAPPESVLVAQFDNRHPADPVGVLGVRVRPGVRTAATGLPDPVLGRFLRALPRLLTDLPGVQRSPRREGGGCQAPRVTPALPRATRWSGYQQ